MPTQVRPFVTARTVTKASFAKSTLATLRPVLTIVTLLIQILIPVWFPGFEVFALVSVTVRVGLTWTVVSGDLFVMVLVLMERGAMSESMVLPFVKRLRVWVD